jgi:hypothetical protein
MKRFTTGLIAAAVLAGAGITLHGSSHREAPFISTQPQLDATDFYMFRSYEPARTNYVTIIADYLPLQAPYGGPNYFKLDPNALVLHPFRLADVRLFTLSQRDATRNTLRTRPPNLDVLEVEPSSRERTRDRRGPSELCRGRNRRHRNRRRIHGRRGSSQWTMRIVRGCH